MTDISQAITKFHLLLRICMHKYHSLNWKVIDSQTLSSYSILSYVKIFLPFLAESEKKLFFVLWVE